MTSALSALNPVVPAAWAPCPSNQARWWRRWRLWGVVAAAPALVMSGWRDSARDALWTRLWGGALRGFEGVTRANALVFLSVLSLLLPQLAVQRLLSRNTMAPYGLGASYTQPLCQPGHERPYRTLPYGHGPIALAVLLGLLRP